MSGDDGEEESRADERLFRFYTAAASELETTPAGEADPDGRSTQERIDEERIEELRDARGYRKKIVTFTLITVGGLVFAATAFMGVYMGSQWHHVEASVVIAYFTSVVVESIGILYVISQYLFPNSGAHRPDREVPDD